MLYRYCSERGIPHSQLGKLIVATNGAQIPNLGNLKRRGEENGVEGLQMLDGEEAMRLEPELFCVKALFSSCSGIVDSHSLMLALLVILLIFFKLSALFLLNLLLQSGLREKLRAIEQLYPSTARSLAGILKMGAFIFMFPNLIPLKKASLDLLLNPSS